MRCVHLLRVLNRDLLTKSLSRDDRSIELAEEAGAYRGNNNAQLVSFLRLVLCQHGRCDSPLEHLDYVLHRHCQKFLGL